MSTAGGARGLAIQRLGEVPNYEHDALVGAAVEHVTHLKRIEPVRPDNGERVILKAARSRRTARARFVTEECLLSSIQARNPGLTPDGYETVFRESLGIRQTIWLGEGCVGDDTHGHVDDIARFTAPGVVVLAYEEDPADDENHRRSVDNYDRLQLAGGDAGALRVVKLPSRAVEMNGERLPASYANFTSPTAWCSCRRSTTGTTASP
jgi:agmatine deiminase